MKQLGLFLSLGALLMLVSCGDDDETTTAPESFNTSDEAAVRAILDANGLTGVNENQVAEYELIDGQYRYVKLRLIAKTGYLGENAGRVIDTLPPQIGNLAKLTLLDFGGMQVRSLPPEIGHLQLLQTLIASGNELTALPQELFTISTLQTLRLDSNQIGTLPDGIGNLTNLRDLRVESNELTQLPSTLTSLTGLQNFVFDDNRICTLTPDMEAWVQQFGLSAAWKTETNQRCP